MKDPIKLFALSIMGLLVVIVLNHSTTSAANEYILGEGDVIEVIVRHNEDLSRTFMIRPDGKISFPLLGDVQVSGLTAAGLKDHLTEELKRYVQLPEVTVIIKEAKNYKVSVLGGGVKSSVVSLQGPTPLLQFLIQLGLDEKANLKGAYVARKNEKLPVDFYALVVKGDMSQNVILEPNDVIFIPPNFAEQIQIVGEVKSPQAVPYREGLRILDVILQAGGLTEYARANSVKVIRKDGDKTKEIKVKVGDALKGDLSKNILLQPGDFIVVPQSLF